ncbi:MAG: hemerythrin domain-containing protein, partial [Sandaracinaceae bacterium]|nr:hemerythrin domain-containing protein [Sandaracinaceae bacterium]
AHQKLLEGDFWRRIPAYKSITEEQFQTDHERLDAIVGEVFEAIESDALREAKQRFSDFACGLRRHIVAEEQVLFPAFEEATGMTRGPTTVMRMEHERIEELLRAIESALDAGDASAAATLETLVGILSDHNQKEEHVLYPTTDRLLGEKGREALVLRMQSL